MGARDTSTVGLAAPNMIGDLLYTSRSVTFGFLRTSGDTNFFGLASTTAVNSSVAENNSPVPADRLYFRYNYFARGQAVTGLSPAAVPILFPDGSDTGVRVQLPQTKKYDVNLYTFGGEKTFLDGLLSVEVRLPVVTTLAPKNLFSVGTITGFTGDTDFLGNPTFNVLTTPQNTLGQTDTYFNNMMVILKGLFYENRCTGLFVTGGTGVGLPTAPDTRVQLIDYAGTTISPQASSQRFREITIHNETVALAPFLAALYLPTERFYTQGFLQVDVPLNSSRVTYTNRQLQGTFEPSQEALAMGSLTPPFTVERDIREQTLLRADWGVGYWIYQAPGNRWLTGVAPSLEVHYTGTLERADREQLPGDATAVQFNPADPVGAVIRGEPQVPEVGPVVGGRRSHMHIVNLTAGTTFTLGQRATLATAFCVPVSSGFNKTFDWEFQAQLNYYFGRR
jgi:hypothetical protein